MELKMGRLLIQEAAWRLAQGEQARVETSIAKVQVSEIVGRALDRCVQICGGRGISRDLPVAGWYEKARSFRIYDGASEVHTAWWWRAMSSSATAPAAKSSKYFGAAKALARQGIHPP